MIQALQELRWNEEATPGDSGFGALQTEQGCLPLKSLQVGARVSGLTARVLVQQCFRNTLNDSLEATYIFPLPDRGAVTSFTMRVGERRIEAELKERAAARADYDRAIENGHRAAIAEEERSGTFTVRVGNIPPGEDASVELSLIVPLEASGGEATFRFPLVVAPRYVPGIPLDGPSVGTGTAVDTDQVPDASRITPPVLLPGFPNPVRLSLVVEIDSAGLYAENWMDRMACSLHSVVTEAGPPCRVRLQPGERLNRDFILRIPLETASVTSSLQVASPEEQRPGIFALTLMPPLMPEQATTRRPRDVVFVLDRSGSMTGWKMVAARRAVGRMIDTLLDEDRFTVIAFDSVCEFPDGGDASPADGPLMSATNRQRWRTIQWLHGIEARGGTEMGPALEAAIRRLKRYEKSGRDAILVLVTDGQVAGEDSLLRTLRRAAGRCTPRIFAVGIDQAVSAGFLRRLADLGGGWCELIESEDRLDETMDRIHRTIATPVLTQIRLEPIGWNWEEDTLVPQPLPDLFAERPVVIAGRYRSSAAPNELRLRIRAVTADGEPWTQEIVGRGEEASLLLPLWGRACVRTLEDRYASGGLSGGAADWDQQADHLRQQIVDASLESGVLSRFTAFVAVDRSEVVNKDGRMVSITQPVELPAGWEMAAPDVDFCACYAMPTVGSALSSVRVPRTEPFLPMKLNERLEIRNAIRRIRLLAWRLRRARRHSTRRRLWDEIATAIMELIVLLGPSAPIRKELREVREAIEQRLRDYDAGRSDAVSGEDSEELLADVLDVLDRTARAIRRRPRREPFWT
ncbi:MAG: VWA domain-containing protein [Planctomycetes bacterium]|nr:VWA domain-containing protein [Planctomycetota bacterium]